jgi:hypothetical protein
MFWLPIGIGVAVAVLLPLFILYARKRGGKE